MLSSYERNTCDSAAMDVIYAMWHNFANDRDCIVH